jgi:hypothetical protein
MNGNFIGSFYLPEDGEKVLFLNEDKLIEVSFKSVRFVPNVEARKMEVAYYVVKHQDEEIKVFEKSKLFQTKDDYQDDACIQFTDSIEMFICNETNVDIDNRFYHNGEIVLPYDFIREINVFDYDFETKEIKVEGFIPKKTYCAEWEALLYNPIIYTDINGNKVIQEGKLQSLVPTDEQMIVIDKINALMKEAKDLNLMLFHDTSTDELYFINKENVRNTSSYGDDYGDLVNVERYHPKMYVSNACYMGSYCEGISVTLKNK